MFGTLRQTWWTNMFDEVTYRCLETKLFTGCLVSKQMWATKTAELIAIQASGLSTVTDEIICEDAYLLGHVEALANAGIA